jgi:hypothetical protein
MILEHLVDELVDILAGPKEEEKEEEVIETKRPRNPPPSSPLDQTPTAAKPE